MKDLYLVTGAGGHLGGALMRLLAQKNLPARGLLFADETPPTNHAAYICGDVRDPESLRPLFEHTEDARLTVIHAAGLVDIGEEVSPLVRAVNVGGTENILALCAEYHARLVYVSSVHAIPERDSLAVLAETACFSPETVEGGYAKTKAEATRLVLLAAAAGLDARVVHPSGILGPFEGEKNHLVQMLADYLDGKLPACVQGEYDFVDVRDVAMGCLLAARRGERGECYLLSNRRYALREVFTLARDEGGGKRLPALPLWMAKAAVPLLERYAHWRGKRPLCTGYALHTLQSSCRFSHDKATAKLGYRPRELRVTVADTVRWLQGGREIGAL